MSLSWVVTGAMGPLIVIERHDEGHLLMFESVEVFKNTDLLQYSAPGALPS